ncbi:MAG: hypothetical protein G01um101472_141 [Parcubacteria group bacterium Gr01-1014_72]|nr:MAG: hypothetical protein G01um101472_141 [Parcubacteria group bacterium Gr01-1014_72]
MWVQFLLRAPKLASQAGGERTVPNGLMSVRFWPGASLKKSFETLPKTDRGECFLCRCITNRFHDNDNLLALTRDRKTLANFLLKPAVGLELFYVTRKRFLASLKRAEELLGTLAVQTTLPLLLIHTPRRVEEECRDNEKNNRRNGRGKKPFEPSPLYEPDIHVPH